MEFIVLDNYLYKILYFIGFFFFFDWKKRERKKILLYMLVGLKFKMLKLKNKLFCKGYWVVWVNEFVW